MMTDFDVAWLKTKSYESRLGKRYSTDPNDPGGETYIGISRVHNPEWQGWPIIDKVKKQGLSQKEFESVLEADQVLQDLVVVFYRHIWVRLHCHEMIEQELAEQLFDSAVNCGETRAVIFLQTALNYLNKNQTLWSDIKVDGILGKKTISALEAAASVAEYVTKELILVRGAYYNSIINSHAWKEAYIYSWLNRLALI